uniref:Uncharacterized protein n=1 Tax=Rhizophora mucronata TaxID=61149 RepID=A0A2P2QXM6_RHIMU
MNYAKLFAKQSKKILWMAWEHIQTIKVSQPATSFVLNNPAHDRTNQNVHKV